MIRVPERIVNEANEYRNKVSEFENGIIEPVRFKPYRVSFGVYEQREENAYMVRTRIPSGVISLKQLRKIKELAEKYSHSKIHFTTRQDIQFHGVNLRDTSDIVEGLLEVGIITRGTGGNTVRNVVCSPLSGVSTDEVFDCLEYAEEATSYLLNDPTTLNLPRKYKIAFSNSPSDTANATISDLGFIAKIKDRRRGFEVYGAGGLGPNSAASILLEEFIPEDEFLFYVQAMKELFENEGDRTNKNKARIRYILYRLGEDEFKNRFRKLVEKLKSERNLYYEALEHNEQKLTIQSFTVFNKQLIAQKQDGLYSVYVHSENGNMEIADLEKIISFVSSLSYEVTIRLTNTQGFFVRDLKSDDALSLHRIISDFVSTFEVDNSVACAGAATCKLGLCLSQNLLSAIRERFKEATPQIKSELPRLFISGCPNSCGQHQKGIIGLSGKALRTAEGLVPAYTIHFNGNVEAGRTKLAMPVADIPARRVPDLLYELAILKHASGYEDFGVFSSKHKSDIDVIFNRFKVVESEKQDLEIYYDFGSDEKFSLKGRGPGECSAGVLDVIKFDITNSGKYLEEFHKAKASTNLYYASLSAARALLILRGIDTHKEREIFREFTNNFIDTGYLNQGTKELIDKLIDFKMGDLDALDDYYNEIKHLVIRVRKMYESLNSHLEITIEKENTEKENTEKESAENEKTINKKTGNKNKDAMILDVKSNSDIENLSTQSSQSYKIVDLRGVKCPINFVKVKIELMIISSGDIIGFYLDDGEPIENVPKSIEKEGHTVISIDNDFERYNLVKVKKK